MKTDNYTISSRRWRLVIALLAFIALFFKLHISLTTYGTNDVLSWEVFLSSIKEFGGIETYHRIWFFNHPPFMIHVLHAMDRMSTLSGLFFPFWLRLPAIVCDTGSLVLVYNLLKTKLDSTSLYSGLALMAVAPTSIMIAGFHGNTDPAMIFFVLLSIYLIESQHYTLIAGVALGISISIKIIPLIFIPVIFFNLPDMRKRAEYFAAALLTAFLSWMPYILQDPMIIWKNVFDYGSIYGHWGLSRIFGWLPPPCNLLDIYFRVFGKPIVMLAIVGLSFWLSRLPHKKSLFHQCGIIVFAFIVLTPGFGVQYLSWPVPWVVALGVWPTAIYYAGSGIFLFLVYNYWSQSFPWYFANSFKIGDWQGYIVFFEMLCWGLVTLILIYWFYPRFRKP